VPYRAAGLASQVEQLLVRRLRSGEFDVGDQLPSEHVLAKVYGVSRATVRLALNALCRRGLIVSRHGVGSFVSEASRIANNLAEAADFSELIRRSGAMPTVIFDHAEVTSAGARSTAALRLADDQLVHRSMKRFCADGQTVIYAITSIPMELFSPPVAAAVLDNPAITEPLFDFCDVRLEQPTRNQVTALSATIGQAVDYPSADLDPLQPLLQMEETGYSRDSRPIWHSLNWYPTGAMQFQLVRQRGEQ
jgi:GntR family transcriptional regulator